MFVEHKEAVEVTEQPAKVLKLSEAIREGSKHLRESKYDYLNGKGCGCAIAMAGVGYGLPADKWLSVNTLFDHVSKNSGLSMLYLQKEVEDKHLGPHAMRALAIADWLEAQGH